MTLPNLAWHCPFCDNWTHRPAPGVDLDYGLIWAHLYAGHEEREGAGYAALIPLDLLRRAARSYFVCPFPDSTHARGRPWVVTWDDDGEEPADTPESNPYWRGFFDIGLYRIAAHMEEMHTDAVYRQWDVEGAPPSIIPAPALNKLRRAGIRGSPGVRAEA